MVLAMTNPTIEAIENRRTTVLFDPTRAVADDRIAELVHLATRAPTSFHLQNWRFIAVRTPAAKERLRAIAWNQAKVTAASVTFIVIGQLADHRTLAARLAPAVAAGIMPAELVAGWETGARSLYEDQPQRQRDEAVRTATLGATTLMHAAAALGLGAGPMIGFDADAVTKEFHLAADEVPVVLVSIGHATPENWPAKPRRPVSEVLELV